MNEQNKIELLHISNIEEYEAFLRQEMRPNGNLSIRCVARMCTITHKALIKDGEVVASKLAESLKQKGFEGGYLAKEGFPPIAVTITLKYYARDSRVKSKIAQGLLDAYGTYGLVKHLEELKLKQEQDNSQVLNLILGKLDGLEKDNVQLKKDNQELRNILAPAATEYKKIEKSFKTLDDIKSLLEKISQQIEKGNYKEELKILRILVEELSLEISPGQMKSLGRKVADFWDASTTIGVLRKSPKGARVYPEIIKPVIEKFTEN